MQLQESEPLVADLQDIIHGYPTSSWFDQHLATLNFLTQLHIHLQEKADSLEEKRVLLERKVARAERDRDIATVSEETPKKPQVLSKILVNLHSELRTGAMVTDLFPEMIIEIGEL